jgi:hypothetical protein
VFVFRKSSRCGGDVGCVEVATTPAAVLMRDSKLADSPVLEFGRDAWANFVADVKAGEFPPTT